MKSSFEIAKGYNKKVISTPSTVTEAVFDAHVRLQVKKKLAKIMLSKSTFEEYFTVGDMI